MKRLTREWLRKARDDLQAVRALLSATQKLPDAACFHCQQAIEKHLKALLCEFELPIPKIHDLTVLAKLLVPRVETTDHVRRRLSDISEFAVNYRYPGKHISPREAAAVARFTESFVRFCMAQFPPARKKRPPQR